MKYSTPSVVSDDLARRVPGARLSEPAGQAADGALLLAQRGLPASGTGHEPYALEFPRAGR